SVYYLDNGGFAEHTRTVTDLGWKIPDNISYEQAVTFSVRLYSAVMCMTHSTRLNVTGWPPKVPEQWVSDTLHNMCCPSRAAYGDFWRYLNFLTSGDGRLSAFFFPFLQLL